MNNKDGLEAFLRGNERSLLLSGPLGSGKMTLLYSVLSNSKTICYSELLVNDSFYESPRQKLLRHFQEAELTGSLVVILAHLEDFMEEVALWFIISEYLSKSTSLKIIATMRSDSRWLSKAAEHFSFHLRIVDDSSGMRWADWKEMQRMERYETNAHRIETCQQLASQQNLNLKQERMVTITLDQFYGLGQDLKQRLLDFAQFKCQADNPRGVLLSGPPGCGKTRLAAALASSLGPKYQVINLAASDLLRSEIGSSEARLREAFALARASLPALIFLDEVESVFPDKEAGHLATLLDAIVAEFDALEREDEVIKVFVLAATNFPEKVSKRLLQSGRLEVQMEIGRPSEQERRKILEKELLIGESGELIDLVAAGSEGCTPAELVKIVQDARKKQIDSGDNHLKITHFLQKK